MPCCYTRAENQICVNGMQLLIKLKCSPPCVIDKSFVHCILTKKYSDTFKTVQCPTCELLSLVSHLVYFPSRSWLFLILPRFRTLIGPNQLSDGGNDVLVHLRQTKITLSQAGVVTHGLLQSSASILQRRIDGVTSENKHQEVEFLSLSSTKLCDQGQTYHCISAVRGIFDLMLSLIHKDTVYAGWSQKKRMRERECKMRKIHERNKDILSFQPWIINNTFKWFILFTVLQSVDLYWPVVYFKLNLCEWGNGFQSQRKQNEGVLFFCCWCSEHSRAEFPATTNHTNKTGEIQ